MVWSVLCAVTGLLIFVVYHFFSHDRGHYSVGIGIASALLVLAFLLFLLRIR